MVSALIIGQAPSASGRVPLDGRTGDRLAKLAGLDGWDELAAVFALTNLLPRYPGRVGKGDHWPRAEARERALRLHELIGEEEWDRVVLLGRNVAAAFGLAGAPYMRWLTPTTGETRPRGRFQPFRCAEPRATRAECFAAACWLVPEPMQHLLWPDSRWAVFPHPSGISHFWNYPHQVLDAARFLHALADEAAPIRAAA